MEINDEYLSIKEFAALLHVHHSTIRRALSCGKIQSVNIGTGKKAIYRIPKSEIGRIALFDLKEMIKKIFLEENLFTY